MRVAGFGVWVFLALKGVPLRGSFAASFTFLLGGSWDLVSKVISTLNEVISIVTLIITIVTKSHDPSSNKVNNL